jgi:hypothetical protein
MDCATPMRKPLIIVFCVLAASLLAPAIAGAESSLSCVPGEILAESSEAGEPECVAVEAEAQEEAGEAAEAEEQEEPEYELIGPEVAATGRGSIHASVRNSPTPAAAPRKAAASRTTKGSTCRRASTAQIRSDRLHVRRLHGKRRRGAVRKLSLALC